MLLKLSLACWILDIEDGNVVDKQLIAARRRGVARLISVARAAVEQAVWRTWDRAVGLLATRPRRQQLVKQKCHGQILNGEAQAAEQDGHKWVTIDGYTTLLFCRFVVVQLWKARATFTF